MSTCFDDPSAAVSLSGGARCAGTPNTRTLPIVKRCSGLPQAMAWGIRQNTPPPRCLGRPASCSSARHQGGSAIRLGRLVLIQAQYRHLPAGRPAGWSVLGVFASTTCSPRCGIVLQSHSMSRLFSWRRACVAAVDSPLHPGIPPSANTPWGSRAWKRSIWLETVLKLGGSFRSPTMRRRR